MSKEDEYKIISVTEKSREKLHQMMLHSINQYLFESEEPEDRGVMKGLRALGFDLQDVNFLYFEKLTDYVHVLSFLDGNNRECWYKYIHPEEDLENGTLVEIVTKEIDESDPMIQAALRL